MKSKPIIGWSLSILASAESGSHAIHWFLVFVNSVAYIASHAHYGRDRVMKVLPLRRRETTNQRSACDLSGWPPRGTCTPQCHRTSMLFGHDLPILYWAQSLEKAQQHVCHICIAKLNQGCPTLLLESVYQQSSTNNPIITNDSIIFALTHITELADIDMHKFNRQRRGQWYVPVNLICPASSSKMLKIKTTFLQYRYKNTWTKPVNTSRLQSWTLVLSDKSILN